ncbi:tetratricopeptide repeat protein [Streptomyces sp. NPDC015661]|uniref:caspase, EACC1-associated type n=1 Tax=Streptomyces sp. NPDC015661 TaxID=3364961 RepID=UPI0036FD6979
MTPARTSRAVLFGVHAYRHLAALDGVRHNAPALRSLLVADDLGGLDPAHCVTVPPDSTAAGFLDAVQDAADEADDLLLVYYAGHGHVGRDDKQLLLSTRESRKARPFHSVPYDEVRAIVAASRAQRKIVIVDSCFSGGALHMAVNPASIEGDFEIEGACVLTSAAQTERSLCLTDGSVFTLELLAVLAGGLPAVLPDGRRGDQQPALTMADLYDTLCARLDGRVIDGHTIPKPRMSTRDNGHRIRLAANRSFGTPVPALQPGRGAALDRPGEMGPGRPRTASAFAPRTQLAPTKYFTGRTEEVAQLEAMAAAAPAVCLIHGRGGLGKSELLRTVAARVSERFPGGCLEIDLRGWTPGETPRSPDAVIAEQLLHLGHAAQDIPSDPVARAESWRLSLERKAVLLILDNARDAAQLAPLLPGAGSQSLVLVSSRSALTDLTWDWSRELKPLSKAECADAWHRMGVPESTTGLGEIADRVHGSPLAVRALSTRLRRGAPPEAVLASLADSSPYRAFPDIDAAERAAFTSAYDALDPELRTLVRHAAVHPGPDFGADSLAAMSGLPEHVTQLRLTEIEQLLTHREGRYGFHDLSLGYARERAAQDAPDEAEPSRNRLYTSLLARLEREREALRSSPDDDEPIRRARRWLDGHAQELSAAARAAAVGGWEDAPAFLRAVGRLCSRESRVVEAQGLFDLLLDAAAEGSLEHAHALTGLGRTYRLQERHTEAMDRQREALALYEVHGAVGGRADAVLEIATIDYLSERSDTAAEGFVRARVLYLEDGNQHGQAEALLRLGDTRRYQHRLDEAEEHYRRAMELYRTLGNRGGQAKVGMGYGSILRYQQQYAEATGMFEESYRLFDSLGDQGGRADALAILALARLDQGHLTEALANAQEALDIYTALGDLRGQGIGLSGLAHVSRAQDRPEEALRFHTRSHRIHREIGDRRGQAIELLGMAYVHLGNKDFDAAGTALHESLGLWRDIDDPGGEGDALCGLARLELDLGLHAEAAATCREALVRYETMGTRLNQAYALALLAAVAVEEPGQGDPAELYRSAADIYGEVGKEESAEWCRHRIAELGP